MKLFLCIILTVSVFSYAVGARASDKRIRLIPLPRELEFKEGEAALDADWGVYLSTDDKQDDYAADLLIREAKDLFGWDWETVPDKLSNKVIILEKYPTEKNEPELFLEQGYVLTIAPEKIVIKAPTATGRFYGVQTLRQIFRNARKNQVPCLFIKDYPALKWRGLSDDVSRGQVSQVDDFQSIIRRLAFYKKNLYQPYIEDMFRFETDPNIGKERGAITKAEMALIAAEAQKNHVTLTPVFECLGHQDRLLSLPENRRYAERQDPDETPWSFSPTSDEAYDFVTSLIDEVARACPSPFFHIGGDESFDVGQGTSKEEVEKLGVGRVHADYFSRLHDHITSKHNRRMMLYADMINRHPDAMEYMPKDCIMVDWHYSPGSDFETAGKLKQAGFSVVTSPGIWGWANYYPFHAWGFQNMARAASVAKEENLMGCITSSWGDSGAENLRENNWPSYAFSAANEWQEDAPETDPFLSDFVFLHFGYDCPELASAIKRLGWTDYLGVHYLARVFHRMPKIKPNQRDWLEDLHKLEQETIKAREEVAPSRSKLRFHKDYPDMLDHVVHRNLYLARREQAMDKIAALLQSKSSGQLPPEKQEEIIATLEELRNDLVQLTGEFSELWLRRYKFPMLDFNLERLQKQIAILQSFITLAKTGRLTAQKPPRGVWFWYPDKDPQKETTEGVRYFVRTVELEEKPALASVKCWADDKATVYVNGERVIRASYHRDPRTDDVTKLLNKGKNHLAVEAANSIGAAGVLIEMNVTFPDKSTLLVTGDEKWRTGEKEIDGWHQKDPPPDWKKVKLLGKGLIDPWKFIDW